MACRNTELLRATLAHIEANPEQWWQGDHRGPGRRGEILDFAARAVVLAGGVWAFGPVQHGPDRALNFLIEESGDSAGDVELVRGVRVVDVRARAKRVLGLDEETARDLFHEGIENVEELRELVDALCASASEEVM
ncbi:hypothetical protein [Nonomuraea sp. NPDC049480]|uniref:hypothetical protein n=1 Tax=Nonomuraea sp. NPDC049480 TaxID=3364353 RepID=UPI00378D6BD9